MEKLDLKKKWKHLYQPPVGAVTAVTVPPLTYLMVDGEGDPNTEPAFAQAVEALYSLSYTLKFSLKKSPSPVDYGVMPLEGLWWADDPRVFFQADKSTWKWTAMILQPDFITARRSRRPLKRCGRRRTPPRSTGSGWRLSKMALRCRLFIWGRSRKKLPAFSACTTSFMHPASISTVNTTRSI